MFDSPFQLIYSIASKNVEYLPNIRQLIDKPNRIDCSIRIFLFSNSVVLNQVGLKYSMEEFEANLI